MKIITKTSLLASLAILLSAAGEAAAQPQVTWQMVGNQVRIDWTAVAGASLYDINVSGTLSGDISIPTTYAQVAAPAGTYVLRVRGRNGGTVGPYSNPVTIVVGASAPPPPAGCAPVGAPAVTASATGNVASIAWNPVAGAIGYRVQVGRGPGATEYQVDLPASQTSFSGGVPMLGTFYTRVLAGSACGAVTPSEEKSFTIGAPTPGPAPPPPTDSGLPFPIPAACSGGVAAGFACAQAVAAVSSEWATCRAGIGVGCGRFTRQVVYALSRSDPNWKMIRAAPGGYSCSCSSCGPSDGTMFREDTTVYGGNRVFDMISGAGGPSPGLYWNEVPGPRAGDIPTDAPVCR